MNGVITTTTTSRPARPALRASQVAAALLWLLLAGTTVLLASTGEEGWEVPYALYAVNVVAALATTAWFAVTAAAGGGGSTPRRVGRAVAVGILGLGVAAAVVVAWAVPLWEAVVGVGLLVLAVSTDRRVARWLAALGVVLLAGIGVAALGVGLRLGDPGADGTFGDAQSWALALTALAVGAVLAATPVRPAANDAEAR